MGMLTAAVQSHYGWQPSERSLANFDVLPTRLADLYPSYGVRPDLLFDFNEGENRWRLAGEARGRSERRPQSVVISAEQLERLEQIVAWSGRNDQHRVTMTWAYSGSDRVQVDLFDIQPPGEAPPQADTDSAEADLLADETLLLACRLTSGFDRVDVGLLFWLCGCAGLRGGGVVLLAYDRFPCSPMSASNAYACCGNGG